MQTVQTRDGSSTLYNRELDEHYHSIYGAYTESRHVYIQSGLQHRYDQGGFSVENPIRVFEVGLGTGLNAVLTAMTSLPVHYTAIELYPLELDVVESLEYDGQADMNTLKAIHQAPWGTSADVRPGFTLHKIHGDICRTEIKGQFDVIYMDAFAPEKQPEMWSAELLSRLCAMLSPQGVLTTYCAKGHIRRLFVNNGLSAERLPGPPGGKREILRITKL